MLEDKLNRLFPKGISKERGAALVLFAQFQIELSKRSRRKPLHCNFCGRKYRNGKALEKHKDICYYNAERNCGECGNRGIMENGQSCWACDHAEELMESMLFSVSEDNSRDGINSKELPF